MWHSDNLIKKNCLWYPFTYLHWDAEPRVLADFTIPLGYVIHIILLIISHMKQHFAVLTWPSQEQQGKETALKKKTLAKCLWILILCTWINTSDKVQSLSKKPFLTFLIWVQLHVQCWEARVGSANVSSSSFTIFCYL